MVLELRINGFDKMIICAVLSYYLIYISAVQGKNKGWSDKPKTSRCLTGHMTDLQPWVDENGELTHLTKENGSSIDVSSLSNVARQIQHQVSMFKGLLNQKIEYLSMAKCKLRRVPAVFNIKDNNGRPLYSTVSHITFYGNRFSEINSGKDKYDAKLNATQATEVNVDITSLRRQYTMWSSGFHSFTFESLKELDLRSCSIQALGNHTFRRMPKLESIYVSDNNIHYIEANVFNSLTVLKHLDLSNNNAYDEDEHLIELVLDSQNIFRNISLESLDLSYSNVGLRNIGFIKSGQHSIKKMSLCYTGLTRIRDDVLNFTKLKYLDVSGNRELLSTSNFIDSFKDSLEVLYAEEAGIKDLENYFKLNKLEILKLTKNEISMIPTHTEPVFPNLQILDLDSNRLTSWFTDIFSSMPKLQLLSLKNNSINVITREMYHDIENLKYISLSGNFLVCNCHSRDIFEVGLKNELLKTDNEISSISSTSSDSTMFHIGFQYYNNIITRRRNLTHFCESMEGCDFDIEPEVLGNYLLLDYESYQCLSVDNGKTIDVFNLATCSETLRDLGVPDNITSKWNRFFLLIIPAVLLPLLLFIYVFRKNFRYFLITMRNSATLSLLNKNIPPDDGTIYNYDVFVSYCNEDRAWVLDSLLPHVERDCNVSVCLHERDFEVGLSILENIVSCMDRSRSIMLIISRRFLLSQWCQFEMHLAQHRLLETRREDLILILLEEIPRAIRPTTLHYLMLTKTYIVWPKEETEQKLFWKRMKKSLVTHKLRNTENVSLA